MALMEGNSSHSAASAGPLDGTATTSVSGPLNRVKIIATLGPASAHAEVVKALLSSGVNVFRLNMSHSQLDLHRDNILMVRRVAESLDLPVALLADLQGPKIRTGSLKGLQPIPLITGQTIHLSCATHESNPAVISTNSVELVDALTPEMSVLIDDGNIELKVLERVDNKTVNCLIIQGGLLKDRKGINVPDANMLIDALTEKDRLDALFALEMKIDYIALSFVQHADDIRQLRTYINLLGFKAPPIIAKIEKPQALKEIDAILEESDGLMVARGDLGVELSPERVPVVQKELIDKANRAEKPVIVATQMLESMINNIHPTRAEASDVANAVFDGCDVVMLSGETAVGAHPVEVVKMMHKIIVEAERHYDRFQVRHHESQHVLSPNFYHAIAHSACYAATKADVKAIVVLSNSGSMARRISKLKPTRMIIALTPDPQVYNQMGLLWGVKPLLIPFGPNSDETINRGESAILLHEFLQKGDSVVMCAGHTPFLGASNMLKIYDIGSETTPSPISNT
jgi:pyruvate kinase